MRERPIVAAYVIALVAFLGLAVVVFLHLERFGAQTARIQHTQHVLTELERSMGALLDLESGQRGYLIAGDERFLAPYETARRSLIPHLRRLRELTRDSPPQQQRLRKLRPLVEEKMAFTERTVDLFRQGRQAEARQLVAGRHGQILTTRIRELAGAMQTFERRLLRERTQEAEVTAWWTNVLFVFGNAFAFAFLTTGTLLLGRELNRRKALEQKVRLQEELAGLRLDAERARQRLEAVVDEMPVGVVLAEAPSGAVVLQNARMRAFRGGAEPRTDEESGLQLLRADGKAYPNGGDPLARALRKGETTRAEELRLSRADGGTTLLMAQASPVRERDGRIIGAVGVFQDVGELRRYEEEREQAQRFRDLFLSALGHDIRNPLSVITAGAASLSRQPLPAPGAKLVEHMTSSAERMARMIDQLLELTRVRLGRPIPVERRPADLREIVRRAVEGIEVLHPERSLVVEAEGDLRGAWDADRIADVVHNLLLNALQHGLPDTPVRVRARPSGDEVVVEVHNWGDPIPRDLLPLIFDPFLRAAERRRMKSVGLGLGLYLAQEAVRAHQGAIDVESSAEAGTTFTVRLPRE